MKNLREVSLLRSEDDPELVASIQTAFEENSDGVSAPQLELIVKVLADDTNVLRFRCRRTKKTGLWHVDRLMMNEPRYP